MMSTSRALVALLAATLLVAGQAQLHGALRPAHVHSQRPGDRISLIDMGEMEEPVDGRSADGTPFEPPAAMVDAAVDGAAAAAAATGASGFNDTAAVAANATAAAGNLTSSQVPDSKADGRPNDAASTELKSSMEEVQDSISYVRKMIEQQVELISRQRRSMVDAAVNASHTEAKQEAKQTAAQKAAVEKAEREAALRRHEASRRMKIDRCLAHIRGGADRLYTKVKKVLSSTPVDSVCHVFKAFEFPNLARHGFHERIYKGPKPDMAGTEVLYFKAAKAQLFECMCETSPSAVSAMSVMSAANSIMGRMSAGAAAPAAAAGPAAGDAPSSSDSSSDKPADAEEPAEEPEDDASGAEGE